MRVAAVMGGEPRFCREFDLFLNSLGGVAVDWFMYFWSNSRAGGTHGFDLVAAPWLMPDPAWAHAKLAQELPPNHRVIALEFADRNSIVTPQISKKAGETDAERMWGMYNSLKGADLLRRQHEAEYGAYDLVIRARPDVGLSGSLDLERLFAESNPLSLYTPDNEQHGYGHRINDMIAVGTSRSITAYCDAVDWIPYYYRQGVIFHPETMLAVHCQQMNLAVQPRDWGQVVLRKLGQQIPNGAYISDYGRWA